MGIYSQDRPFPKRATKLWDPYVTFEIINPDRGTFTCVGHAPSKGRRCRYRIGAWDIVYSDLDYISTLSPGDPEIKRRLREIAIDSLCVKEHKKQAWQADAIVEKWTRRLVGLSRPGGQERTEKTNETGSKYSESRSKRPSDYSRSFFNYDGQPRSDDQSKSSARQEWHRQKEETKEEKPPKEEDAREKMREDARQRHEEQEQQKTRQQDEEEREQKSKQRERERKEQDHQSREDQAREKAQEQERKAKDQAAKQKREWQQAWHSYVTNWVTFKNLKDDEKPKTVEEARRMIPWPTKSGEFRDVTRANVLEFYRNACPDAGEPDKLARMMRMESLKWHPDKFGLLYHDCEVEEVDKEVMKVICLVVLDLKEKADNAKSR